ncbi:MAG TPA: hypothetical protein VL402_09000 [Xanthobacteraceae bacterium]|nr:hypothetical protein [Xanthobacteraceae bacterium]
MAEKALALALCEALPARLVLRTRMLAVCVFVLEILRPTVLMPDVLVRLFSGPGRGAARFLAGRVFASRLFGERFLATRFLKDSFLTDGFFADPGVFFADKDILRRDFVFAAAFADRFCSLPIV